jgi:RNA polymerase sigma-70 factor (ECF subfamily)
MGKPHLAAAAPDEALMPRIAAGDAVAFAELFDRRQAEVFRFALLMSQSHSVAEDVTQDVFVQVMHDAARFDPARGSLRPWLLGIAKNFVRRRFERDRGWLPLADERGEVGIEIAADGESPLGDLTRSERIELLRRAILTLPLSYREAVVLCDIQEMTYADAAVSLGCAVGTVRSRLHRARALLAAKITAMESLPDSGEDKDRKPPRGVRCIA